MSSLAKHGGGSVMAKACMTASGTASLIFIDDVNGNNRMNSALCLPIYREIHPM